MLRRAGQALFKFITCLSLLASIGSFVIAALPVLPLAPSMQQNQQSTARRSLENHAPAPPVSAQPARPHPVSEWSGAGRNELVIRYCLSFVAICAGALAIIRLIRLQCGDLSK
jgi:hypothetical protein